MEEALSQAQTVCRRDGRFYMARVVMASVLTRLGRMEEASAAIIEARRVRPELSLEEIARFFSNALAAELKAAWNGR